MDAKETLEILNENVPDDGEKSEAIKELPG